MCNVEGLRGITITKKRRTKLMAEIESWMALEPEAGELTADPRELASFLGKLVFVSQVVAGGRTYMQGMLNQFKGLLVDWQRGQVKPSSGGWRELSISGQHRPTRALPSASQRGTRASSTERTLPHRGR